MDFVIVLYLIFLTSTCAHRHSKNSLLEGLYLNTSDGCREFENKHPQNICQEYKNMSSLLITTAYEAVKQCRLAFQYALWPCVIDKHTFSTITREHVFLTSLYSAFLTLKSAEWCSIGKMANCSNKGGDAAFFVNFGSLLAKAYLRLETYYIQDPIDSVISHSINFGISVVKRSLQQMCKCYGISGSCCVKTCWFILPSYTHITLELKKYYEDSIHWNSNSLRPANELKKLKNKLIYLDDSVDYCNNTKNRRCNNEESCFYVCCGKDYFPAESYYKKYRCMCSWKGKSLQLQCKVCIYKTQVYTCG